MTVEIGPSSGKRISLREIDAQATEKFWRYVEKVLGGCWLWTGAKQSTGYGNVRIGRRSLQAHRVSWVLANGNLPNKTCVLHKCDIRNCVNPDHLFLGTQEENNKDAKRKGRSRGPALRGEKNGQTKLTEEQVMEMRKLHAMGNCTFLDLGEQFGVGAPTAYKIVRGYLWKHVS